MLGSDQISQFMLDDLAVYIAERAEFPVLEWTAQAPVGIWAGYVLEGRIETHNSLFGKQYWKRNHRFAFCNETSVDTHHRVVDETPFSCVFVYLDTENQTLLSQKEIELLNSLNEQSRVQVASPAEQAIARRMSANNSQQQLKTLNILSDAMSLLSYVSAPEENATRICSVSDGLPGLTEDQFRRLHSLHSELIGNLSKPPSIPTLAKSVGVSERKLNEAFQHLYGLSAYAFVKLVRLECARELLLLGNHTVAQVAYEVGYEPAHFATAFRKEFDQSPSDLLPGR